jgi:hypothetical protein
MAWQWALGAGIIFTGSTALRILGSGKKWHPWIPGGIAVAVGILHFLLASQLKIINANQACTMYPPSLSLAQSVVSLTGTGSPTVSGKKPP